MFSGFKDWLLGRTPDYQSVGSKMADQVYSDESKPTNRTAIVKMSRVGPVALLDTSKRVSSPIPRRQSMFSMEKDFSPEGKTKLPGDDGAIISIPPLVDVSTPSSGDSNYQLIKVMWFQHVHDQNYHRDIAHMPMMQRVGHLNNHLVKYTTRYIKFSLTGTYAAVEIVDGIICCISALSSLHYNPMKLTLPEFFVNQRVMPVEETLTEIGRISKILEGWDHLEDIDYRAELKESFCVVLASLLNIYYNHIGGCFITDAYEPRLNGIKQKHPFHNYMLGEGKILIKVETLED